MDYKLNILNEEIKCEEVGIPDLPALKFGRLDDGTLLFNATLYMRTIDLECDYRTFSRSMRFWIESMASGYGVKVTDLFYQNPNGDQLFHEILVYLLIMYTNPDIIVYFNDVVDDVMTNGIAFSDSFVMELASTRLTPDLLKTLVNERNRKESSSI